jgi:hypothetical protein
MFLYFYPVLYSQREVMPTLIVFHSEHRDPNFSSPKKPVSCKICLIENFMIWVLKIFFFKSISNIPAQKFYGSVQRQNFGQDFDRTKMGLKRFENFEQVQILIVWKKFFNIPSQKIFGSVQRKITRHIRGM